MKILTIDAKRNSLKFHLYEMKNEEILASGSFEGIGMESCHFIVKYKGEKIEQEIELDDYSLIAKVLIDKFIDLSIITADYEIDGIGHRLKYGKEKYKESVIINDEVIRDLEMFQEDNVWHIASQVLVVKAFKQLLPNTLMVGVFDTSFYQSMEDVVYLYPVPYEWYKKYAVRKYGFQGISHRYVMSVMKEVLGNENSKVIICHIGRHSSITAVKDMKCVDTSAGFTPLAGMMTGTHSGDIDPSIIPYVMEKEGKNASEVIDDLNHHSGLVGLSEYSDDMRLIMEKCDLQDEKCLLARNKYIRKIVDYIAQYYVLLGGVDAIVFTAGVLENSVSIRREICERLACLGVKLDLDINNRCGETVKISTQDSSLDVYVVPTNEELMIARDTFNLVNR